MGQKYCWNQPPSTHITERLLCSSSLFSISKTALSGSWGGEGHSPTQESTPGSDTGKGMMNQEMGSQAAELTQSLPTEGGLG